MKSLLVVLVVLIGGGFSVLALKFGTVTPCGILRAEIRQEAAREGGFSLVVSALPDSAIDAILAAQFGPMSPGRCIQVALSEPPVRSQAPQRRPNPEQAAERYAQMRAAQLANLRNLTERMSVFTTKADAMLPKFSPVEERYRYITERMRAALARERSIYGSGQASVARGQISVAISQASIQANQIHIGVQSSYRDFGFKAGQLERESMGADRGCRGTHVATDAAPTPVAFEDWNSACLNFFDVDRQYDRRVSELRVAFAQIEEVWQAEHQQQDEIVQASNAPVQ
jgi:hypothetical protein